MVDQTRNGSTERSFFTSLIILLSSVILIFTFLIMYSPSDSQLSDDSNIAEEQTSIKSKNRKRASRSSVVATSDSAVGRNVSSDAVNTRPNRLKTSNTASDYSGVVQTENKEIGKKIANAIELIDSGNAKEAQDILEQVLLDDPKNEQALVELGMIHLIDYRSADVALQYLEDALRVNSGNKIVLSELVGIYEELEISDQGLSFLKGIQESDVDNSPLNLGIGQILSGQGRDADAIPFLEAAAASDQQAEFVLTDLADAYSSAGFPEKALNSYKNAIDREKSRLANSSQVGRTDFGEERLGMLQMDYVRELIRQGRYDDADETLGDVSERLPDDEAVSALYDQINRKRAG